MYSIPVSTCRKIYITLMDNVFLDDCSRILPFSSPPIVNYASRHYRDGDARLKERFESVLEMVSVEMVLAAFAHAARYIIRYSRQGDSPITHSPGYGVLTPLPHATTHIISSSYVTELFYGGDVDVGLVRLSIKRKHEMDGTYVESFMEDQFLWYD